MYDRAGGGGGECCKTGTAMRLAWGLFQIDGVLKVEVSVFSQFLRASEKCFRFLVLAKASSG